MANYWEDRGGIILSANNISQGVSDIKSSECGLYVIVNRWNV